MCDGVADLVPIGVGDHPSPRQELRREEEATLMPGLRPFAHPTRTPWGSVGTAPSPLGRDDHFPLPISSILARWPRFTRVRERKQF